MAFNKFPSIKIQTYQRCLKGWTEVLQSIEEAFENKKVLVVECYQGAYIDRIIDQLTQHFSNANVINASSALKSEQEVLKMTHNVITDDRIFGRMNDFKLSDFFDEKKVAMIKDSIQSISEQTIIVGAGASLLCHELDIMVYVDMARWEIQQRMRRKEVANIGLSNQQDNFETLYKRGYFLDWRVCDDHKRNLIDKWNYVLDTNDHDNPKMISGSMFQEALEQSVSQPFSLVPFFDPGPWGGQWMREKFDLDPEPDNFAWCFNCVPEENSLLLDFDGIIFETPSINLVFFQTTALLGSAVESNFGAEFPIRFDFLDTIQGGNLSLQVHPTKEYIEEQFGMSYTQDESYYILDADDNAKVYLGLKDDVDPDSMINALNKAQLNGNSFDADKYSVSWPAKKHDHFLIPAGTVHCSGTGCMVLEISATPYIFTFKLWDWGRLGLDGKPRPINISHGQKVIQWDRRSAWTKENLINTITTLENGSDCKEEQTGLHESEFIETRRHWHSSKVLHQTGESVNVLMIVEGDQALVECPENSFDPFVVNYAEAFIIPAAIKNYTVTPTGPSLGKQIATVKAFVRT